jgi:uncharacterized Zn finger protein
MAWYRDYHYFKPSKPREAKAGVKARSKRGAFAQNWWGKRWEQVIESFDLGARLNRGKSYARNGQVVAIDIAKGKISAKVQGSRVKPYDVEMQVKTLSPAEWDTVIAAMQEETFLVAALLAGQMPEDLERVFAKAKLSLFPVKRNDLETQCSCPDWSNPCKHIAAVYYLICEEFDRDPFLVFRLRGLGREELIARLGALEEDTPRETETPPESLSHERDVFWTGGDCDFPLGELVLPSLDAPLVRRLGAFPFWRGADDFLQAMEQISHRASAVGQEWLAGE